MDHSTSRTGWRQMIVQCVLLWCLPCSSALAAGAENTPKTLAECGQRIPESLRILLKERYPGRVLDLNQWRYEGIPRDHKCGVAIADFDGNGEDDVALLLTRKGKGKGGTVILAALRKQDQWDLHMVHRAEESGLYVAVASPGKHTPWRDLSQLHARD
jgi:hypothetical protein